MTKGVVKRRPGNENSPGGLGMAVAFIAGMAITAVLAQTPVAADIFPRRVTHEPVAPAPPNTHDFPKTGDSTDNRNPAPYINELVYTLIEEAASPC